MKTYKDSDLICVYTHKGELVGHMWYATFIKIHGPNWCMQFYISTSDHNGPDNVAEYERLNG